MIFTLAGLLLTQNTAEIIQETVSENIGFFSLDHLAQYARDSVPTVLDFLMKVIIAIIVLLVGRKLIHVFRKAFRKFMEKRDWDVGVRQFFDHLVYVALHFLLIMIVLSKFGITASTVIALIGSAGLSVGLALQGSLSNFAGGVLILLLKPFKVGDYIKEDHSGNEGFVTSIQLFYTKLRTYDNKIVILPNGTLSNGSLTNYTQMDKRGVDITVGISYHADLRKAKEVIRRIIDEEEKRLPDENHMIYVSDLADSSVDLGIRVWVKTEDYWEVKWRLTENIKYALDENGIEIPFPQVTVSYEKTE